MVKSRRREGIVRRPIEYVLLVTMFLLICLALWAGLALRRENANQREGWGVDTAQHPLEGTIDEIDWLTDYDVREEKNADAIMRTQDQKITQPVDAAADNIGSALDEAALPSAICDEISQVLVRSTESFDTLITAYYEAKTGRQAVRSDSLRIVSEAISSSRAKQDISRAHSFGLLAGKAGEEYHGLVTVFRTKVDEGVALRRTSFDAARGQYLQDIDNFIAQRYRAVEDGFMAYRAASHNALLTARSSCMGRAVDQAAVRQELARNISQARLAYAEVLRGRAEAVKEVQKYQANKNDAYSKALATFEQLTMRLKTEYQDLRR